MTQVAIIGVGETLPQRADPRPLEVMVAEAVALALADAGLAASVIDGFVTEAATMPKMMPAEAVAAALGVPMPSNPFIVTKNLSTPTTSPVGLPPSISC